MSPRSHSPRYQIACVGGGIVGLATAMTLVRGFHGAVVVLEAEDELATHQTGHNSGVLHSGLYYQPGSLKARNCVAGRRALVAFCQEHDIPHEVCGKLVVATSPEEIPRLTELERRGRANGLQGLCRLGAHEVPDYEPHARALEALWVPETGIVDFRAVARAYAREVAKGGGEIRTRCRVLAVKRDGEGLVLETTQGPIQAARLINCAGLECDRLARMAGARPDVRIVPFRGEYFELVAERRHLVRNSIYPVPDPRFPFLGVHVTRGIDRRVEAGPNAVLALRREDYGRRGFSLRDTAEILLYPGFWRMGARHWRRGARELLRSGSRRRFARALRKFLPEVEAEDLRPAGCGVRAQALDTRGRLLDDFHILQDSHSLHVLNAPSPAATSSLAIGLALAGMAETRFSLRKKEPGPISTP